MDSIEFVNSIQISDFRDAITRFFDEFMALHNLVGEYNSIETINGEIKNGVSIAFQLNFQTKEDAITTNYLLSGINVNIYGRQFSINKFLDDKTLSIEFVSIQ